MSWDRAKSVNASASFDPIWSDFANRQPTDGYPPHHLTNPMEILRHSLARSLARALSRVTERMANFLRGVLLCKGASGERREAKEGGKFDELWARIDLSIRSAKASRRIRVISSVGKRSSPESICVIDTRTSLSLIITPRMLNIRTTGSDGAFSCI